MKSRFKFQTTFLIALLSLNGNVLSEFIFFNPEDIGSVPVMLSQLGLYNGKTITVEAIPYAVNMPHWTDSILSHRYIITKPGAQITYNNTSDYYGYPDGIVFVQTLYIGSDYLETRLLVKKDGTDEWFPFNYRWNGQQTDAELVVEFYDSILTVQGNARKWRYDDMWGCAQCHTGRYVQGFFTAQLNRPSLQQPATNQITYFFNTGLFTGTPPANLIASPKWIWEPSTNDSTTREIMVRGYLASNCSPCHGAKGHVEGQDLNMDYHTMQWKEPDLIDRYTTVSIPGCWTPKLIMPGDPNASTMYFRQAVRAEGESFWPPGTQQPPTASYIPDTTGLRVIYDWICSLDPVKCESSDKCPEVEIEFPVSPCQDTNYLEYGTDEPCLTLKVVYGCMHPDYEEYNPEANVADPEACKTLDVRMKFNKSGELTIQHNPFSNSITIAFSNSTATKSLSIYTLKGILVKKFETDNNSITWYTQGNERGVYYIRAVVDGEGFIRKVIL
jgi:mono/diheme cytochrome c family protein